MRTRIVTFLHPFPLGEEVEGGVRGEMGQEGSQVKEKVCPSYHPVSCATSD